MGSQHAFHESHVAEPKVFVAGREIMVRWFGVPEEDESLAPRGQFFFPLTRRLEDIPWIGDPRELQVVFLDQAKNFPDRGVVAQIAEDQADGAEALVVILCSDRSRGQYPRGEDLGTFTFVSGIMLLGDSNIGYTMPQRYQNLGALSME
ncbi:MAG: hypothetical protein KJI72_03115 [Patescibacteria group bacterium]|nr:hypothetical protein [Patescibacteria group bacterium]